MDREQVAKHAGVIPPANLTAFLEYLVRTPELPGLVDVPHPTEIRLQGDLLQGLPCAYVDGEGVPHIAPFTVAVLNNTCDLQPSRSKYVTVAPVFDYRAFADAAQKARGEASAKGYLKALRDNQINEFLFLPTCPGYEQGALIALDRASSISTALYDRALNDERRVASFTQNGFYIFLLKITRFLARAESAEVSRVAVG